MQIYIPFVCVCVQSIICVCVRAFSGPSVEVLFTFTKGALLDPSVHYGHAYAHACALVRLGIRDRKDPKSGLAIPNKTVSLSGLVLICIEADFLK